MVLDVLILMAVAETVLHAMGTTMIRCSALAALRLAASAIMVRAARLTNPGRRRVMATTGL